MKTKQKIKKQNKNKARTEKILALTIIMLFIFSIVPSFSLADGYGCMDPDAENYDPDATIDDGSCVPKDVPRKVPEQKVAEGQGDVDKDKDLAIMTLAKVPQIVAGFGNLSTKVQKQILKRLKNLGLPVDENTIPTPDELDKILDANQDKIDSTEKIVKEETEKYQNRWKLSDLAPCKNSPFPSLDCILDIGTTTISVIWGIGMGINLARIKGSCSAEEPLKGLTAQEQEEACKSCNEDPLRLCTLDRCLILGNCIPVKPEEGTPEEMANFLCIPGKCEETGVVGIKSIETTFYYGGQIISASEFKNPQSSNSDKLNINGKVPFNSDSMSIELTTDKLAQCRYSFEAQQDFENMNDFDDNYFPGTYDEPESQAVVIMLPGSMPRNQEHTVYIKCNNVCGKAHDKYDDNHFVRFTFEEKPDQLPPIIVAMDPPNMGAVSGDLTELTVEFELDERGYCKFSDNWTLDKNDNPAPLTTVWEEMIKFDDSAHYGGSAVTDGYCQLGTCQHLQSNSCSHCFLDLDLTKGYTEYDWEELSPELQEELGLEDKVKFFHYKIRCADTKENKMPEEDTLDYSFFVVPPYEMKIVKPADYSSTYEINPDIEVTSTRKTNCRYLASREEKCKQTYPAWEEMLDIDGLFAEEHLGNVQDDLIPSIQGTPYCLYVTCRDTWQLERSDNAFFKIFKDIYNPKVIRMYHDIFVGDYLLIETDEDATCVYGTDDEIKCNYDFDKGNEMTGNSATIHTAYWSLDHLYYIRCQDQWGNIPIKGQCTAIINPFEIPAVPF